MKHSQRRCARCKQVKSLDEMAQFAHFQGLDMVLVPSRICRVCHGKPRERTDEQIHRERVAYQNRMAKAVGLRGDLTVEQWKSILGQSQGKCYYCSKYVGVMSLVIEHRIPISRGGDTTMENVTAACKGCNWDKCSKTEEEYRALL
jgi:5-methylcytosine-specific restriction endonuclease McrA